MQEKLPCMCNFTWGKCTYYHGTWNWMLCAISSDCRMDESQESRFYCGLSSGSVNTIQLIFQIQGLVGKNYFIFNSKSFQNDIEKLVKKKS